MAPPLRGIRAETQWICADGFRLAELASLGLTTRVAETMPLADAAEAQRPLVKGGLRERPALEP